MASQNVIQGIGVNMSLQDRHPSVEAMMVADDAGSMTLPQQRHILKRNGHAKSSHMTITKKGKIVASKESFTVTASPKKTAKGHLGKDASNGSVPKTKPITPVK